MIKNNAKYANYVFLITIHFIFIGCQGNIQHKINENNISLSIEEWKNGDLVFVSGDLSSFDEAITSVTKTKEDINFSHVGLINCTDSGIFIIEAITKGVCYTSLDTFLCRNSNSTIQIVRLKTDYQKYIPEAIEKALSYIGKEYDFAFDMTNDAYYCSELLYFAFTEASGDSLFFELNPMTFIDKTTDEFHPYWVAYFAELNKEVPEGKLGLNPNGMSLSDKLEWMKE